MPEAVYRMLTLLCALVRTLPIGTNLGLLHLLWMLVSGQLLAARGAVMPGLRADIADPSPAAHARLLVGEAVRQCATDDVLVLDAGFGLALLQAAGASRYVVRLAKNATFRRAAPPPYGGRGRPPTRGAVVRP